MTSKKIKKMAESSPQWIATQHPTIQPLWEITYQLAVQAEQQVESIRLTRRCVELQEKAHAEPGELRKRVDELLRANNAELERTRKAEGQLRAAEQHVRILLDARTQPEPLADPPAKIFTDDQVVAIHVIRVLKSCAQTIRENSMDSEQAADYLTTYAAGVKRNNEPLADPPPPKSDTAPERGTGPNWKCEVCNWTNRSCEAKEKL